MKRIDPLAVATFFKAHPTIEPIQGLFAAYSDEPGNVDQCCGLTSQIIENPNRNVPLSFLSEFGPKLEPIAAILALDVTYAAGFARGWDERPLDTDVPPAFRLGHIDGTAAIAATIAMEAAR